MTALRRHRWPHSARRAGCARRRCSWVQGSASGQFYVPRRICHRVRRPCRSSTARSRLRELGVARHRRRAGRSDTWGLDGRRLRRAEPRRPPRVAHRELARSTVPREPGRSRAAMPAVMRRQADGRAPGQARRRPAWRWSPVPPTGGRRAVRPRPAQPAQRGPARVSWFGFHPGTLRLSRVDDWRGGGRQRG